MSENIVELFRDAMVLLKPSQRESVLDRLMAERPLNEPVSAEFQPGG
jgi:hypothetical protein